MGKLRLREVYGLHVPEVSQLGDGGESPWIWLVLVPKCNPWGLLVCGSGRQGFEES